MREALLKSIGEYDMSEMTICTKSLLAQVSYMTKAD